MSTRILSTCLLLKKTFFSFFTLTPSQMWLKRPVYRGFSGEGKCEGKNLPSHYPHHLPSHLTLPTGSMLLAGDSMDGRQIQWAGCEAAVYREYSFGILLVQLCCTVGATMLPLLVQLCCHLWYCYVL